MFYRVIATALFAGIGWAIGAIMDEDEKSRKKVSGTALADDAETVPSSTSADSDAVSESSDQPAQE